MPANCDCPICGSRNTKSLQVIYESGQRFGRATRHSLWSSWSGSVWTGRSTTYSHSSNLLSDNAAPPGQFPWPVVALPTVIAVVLFNLSFWVIPLVIFSIAILYGGSSLYIQSSRELASWQKTFRCLRCGNTFSSN